jgi:hypothetical protein
MSVRYDSSICQCFNNADTVRDIWTLKFVFSYVASQWDRDMTAVL